MLMFTVFLLLVEVLLFLMIMGFLKKFEILESDVNEINTEMNSISEKIRRGLM